MTQEMGRSVSDTDARGKSRVQTVNTEPSKTIQSQAQQADIKFILKQYPQVKLAQMLNEADLRFGDITELTDYAEAAVMMRQAEEQFMTLPSKVREIFGHDVANWLDAAEDPDKRDRLIEAGLLPPEAKKEDTTPAVVVPPSTEENPE